MSWSFNKNNVTANEVLSEIEKVTDTQFPPSIRSYVRDGIQSLQNQYGNDVKVSVNASGHLFTGESGNDETTTANISIRPESMQSGSTSQSRQQQYS